MRKELLFGNWNEIKSVAYPYMHVVQQEGHKCAKVWTAVTWGQELINETVYWKHCLISCIRLYAEKTIYKFFLKPHRFLWEEKSGHLFPGSHSVIRSRITACIKYAERRSIWYDTRELSLNTPADDATACLGLIRRYSYSFYLFTLIVV